MRWLALLALSAAACAESGPIYFTLPDTEGASSMLLAFDRASLLVIAMNLDDPQPAAVTYGGEDVRVYGFLYAERLEDLGIAPGRLTLHPNGRRVADPFVSYVNVVREDGAAGWSPIDAGEVLAKIELEPEADPCASAPRFEARDFELETKTNGRSAVDLGDGSVLVTAQDYSHYRLTRDALTRLHVDPPPRPAVFRTTSGELWTGGLGDIWRGTLETGFTQATMTSTTVEIGWIAGPPNLDPFEMYILDYEGGIHAFDGQRMRRVEPGRRIFAGGIAWVAPGHLFISRHSFRRILEINGDQTHEIDVFGRDLEPMAIAYNPAAGVLLGAADGSLHLRGEDGRWTQVAAIDADIQDLAPYEDGFVIGGGQGYVGTYTVERGACVEQILRRDVERIAVVGSDLAITQTALYWQAPELDPLPTRVSWLTRTQ